MKALPDTWQGHCDRCGEWGTLHEENGYALCDLCAPPDQRNVVPMPRPLGPGERRVGGRVLYSARWLAVPLALVALVLPVRAQAAAVPPPRACYRVYPATPPGTPVLLPFIRCLLGQLRATPVLPVQPGWIEIYPVPCTLQRPCPVWRRF